MTMIVADIDEESVTVDEIATADFWVRHDGAVLA